MPESRWTGRVDDLVLACADALRALTPHLERVGLAWQEGQRYDEFDHIADAIWSSFVIDSALVDPRFASLTADDFRPLGFQRDAHPWRAWVEVRHIQMGKLGVLLDFGTTHEPFDTAVVDGPRARVPLADLAVGFAICTADGEVVEKLAD